jgi:hypothetical protein
MYASFFVRLKQGHFSLSGRNELWRLLVTLTLNKARKAAERQRSQRRDYRREGGPAQASLTPQEMFAQLEDAAPTPADAAELTEELEQRLRALPKHLQQIALWKLEGYTNEEIAAPERLDCSVRTVERKLCLIRELWEAQD